MSWRCSCGTVMPSFKVMRCSTCGKDKNLGESLIRLRGDWLCTNCQKNNFARRTKCFSCGVSKNSGSASCDQGSPKPVKRSIDDTEREEQKTRKSKIPKVTTHKGAEEIAESSSSGKHEDPEVNDDKHDKDDDDEALLSEI